MPRITHVRPLAALWLCVSTACACDGASFVELRFAPHGEADESELETPGSDASAEAEASTNSADLVTPDAGPMSTAQSTLADSSMPAEEPRDPMGCYLYIEALCERIAECRNLPNVNEGCLGTAAGCVEFADGSASTNAGLDECTDQYASFSCDLLLRGRRLVCVTPGERVAGEPCSLSLNCQSLVCDFQSDVGYVCAALAEPGDACSDEVACPLGFSCTGGVCQETPPPDFDNGNLPLGPMGTTCRDPHQCQEGLFCAYSSQEAELGVCGPRPGAGQECGLTKGYDWFAALPAACDAESTCVDGTCEQLPAVGQPCAEQTFVDQRPCATGAYCDEESGECAPWRELGEACVGSSSLSGLTGLPLDAECDPSTGARCLCADGTTNCDSAQRSCRIRVNPGQACDFEHAACVYGSRCVDGACDYPLSDN